MRFPRFRSPRRPQPNPEAWHTRQHDILGRLIRGTEAPTDTLPVLVNPESTQLSEYYDARLGEVLELAVSIGSVLMASGTSASDTVIQVKAIAAAYGIENCDVDVTNTVIFIAVYRGPTLPPASTLHTVRSRAIDFSRLAAVDRLIRRICTEPLPPPTARAELDRIVTAPHPYKRWVATLAWGGLAFSLAGTLGGDLVVCLVSALSTMLIDRVNRLLNRHGLPFFFQHAVGGAIATAPPLALYLLGPKFGLQFDPTIAIAAGLVVLLAGLSLVGSVQDVITGAPVTSVARFFELVMLTAATIAGVAFVLHVAARFGAPDLTISPNAPPALGELTVRVAFGAVSSAAFALACYTERRALLAAAIGGAAGVAGFLFAQGWGLSVVVASFAAAVPVGLVGRLMERRHLTPPLMVSISGITPLLPGLSLLHGVYAILSDELTVGFASVLGALAISTALAAGVTLGEWGSGKIRRPEERQKSSGTQGVSPFRRPYVEHSPNPSSLATGAGNPAIAPLRVRRIRPSGSSHVHRSFTNQKPILGRQGYRDAQDGRSDQPDRSPRFPEHAPGGSSPRKSLVPEAAAGPLPPVAGPPGPGPHQRWPPPQPGGPRAWLGRGLAR